MYKLVHVCAPIDLNSTTEPPRSFLWAKMSVSTRSCGALLTLSVLSSIAVETRLSLHKTLSASLFLDQREMSLRAAC